MEAITINVINTGKSFTFVGNIPVELCEKAEPTRSDILGQRWNKDEEGNIFVWSVPRFETADDAIEFVEEKGFHILSAIKTKSDSVNIQAI